MHPRRSARVRDRTPDAEVIDLAAIGVRRPGPVHLPPYASRVGDIYDRDGPLGLDEYVSANCDFAREQWAVTVDGSNEEQPVKGIFTAFLCDCVELTLIRHCKRSRSREVKWLMHFIRALPVDDRMDFFRPNGYAAEPLLCSKTSAQLARDIGLVDFVFGRAVDPTLEDVQFAHSILGLDFELSRDHWDRVFECDADDILEHLFDGTIDSLDEWEKRLKLLGMDYCETITVPREDLPDHGADHHIFCTRYIFLVIHRKNVLCMSNWPLLRPVVKVPWDVSSIYRKNATCARSYVSFFSSNVRRMAT